MNISKRLRVISEFIPDNSFVLDIGCDHALLDIYTCLQKDGVKCVASDVKEGPLQMAKKNVAKYNVSDRVSVVLADGLASYKKGVNIVVISGLGSSTIVDILKKGTDALNDIETLIISSNNDYYYLRNSICNLGFYICDESIVLDKGKYYPIVVFKKGFKKYNKYELKYGPVLLNKKSSVFLDYLKYEKEKLCVIYKSLGIKHFLRKTSVKKDLRFINSIIK